MKNHKTDRFAFLWLLALAAFWFLTSYKVSAQQEPKLVISGISISGNRVTKEHVILREITIHQGDSLTPEALGVQILQSEKFLINTHLFLNDTITDSIRGNHVYLYIYVKERFNIDFWHPQLSSTGRDINTWLQNPSLYRLTFGLPVVISNFTGQYDKLTLIAIFGWRQTYGIDYKVPYINSAKTLGIENLFTYQQGHEVGDITEDNNLQYVRVDQQYIYHKISWETDLIYRPKYQVTHVFTIGFDYYDVGDTISHGSNPDYLGNGRNIIRVPRIAYRLIDDKRDFAFYATKGYLINFSIEHDGLPVLFKDINLTTADITGRKFIPLGGRFYYEGGFTSEYDFQSTLPYVYRSATSLGYRYIVRGFENYVIDGRAYIVAEDELKYLAFARYLHLPYIKEGKINPAPLDVYIKIYADQGAVFYNPVQYNNNLVNKLLSGWGTGLDITTYYDFILRLEYSFNNLGKSGAYVHLTEVF